ncbi:MAG: ABC transporter ATP-binding protein [Deltaproteobacteria bacterium]|nr:MAG: ABC transporter ATP-binding protein [Deltaproteobacteria bacterium]
MLEFILGKDIARYVKRHKALMFLSMALTAVSSLFVVVPAYLLQPFVDEGMKLGNEPVSWKIPWIAHDPGTLLSWHKTQVVIVDKISPNELLILLSVIAFVAVFLKAITIYFSGLSAAAFSNRAVKSLRIDLFKKFVSLPLEFYENKKGGELVARATADLTVLQDRIATVLSGLIQHPLTVIVFLIYLIVMNWKLTALVFVTVPIIIGLIRLFGRKVRKNAIKVQDATAQVTSAYQEILLCMKLVHGFFQGEKEAKKFAYYAENLYKRVMNWARWDLGLSPIMDVTLFLLLPGILIAGKVYFHHTLGELMSMIYAFSRVYVPVKKLARVHNSLRTMQGATKRVFGIMNTEPVIKDRIGAKDLPRHKESIKFEDVKFGYNDNELILRDVSLEVKAGEMVAFVGSTGAGKSTLLDLIPRFYDVRGGAIRIDGVDIRDVTLSSLRRQIGIVSQDTLLFHDTIANNIRYGHPAASIEEVIEAAKAANAHEFILAQPRGYDTVIGDQGIMLSGGQKQRIAIARALLPDPAILILDEAASALDAESERLVQESIENLHGTRTILVVAHRLSTILRADRIYVVEDGRIIESGNLEELLALNGRFRQLHDLQFGG